ncbi:hypothetical protein L596_020207 [Steinernema carpocapsae]|uniref:Uncharacterized protein n=1 Tax=Steinernema carpocapsae TaxID=34508 RepID=A0A4U5MSX1_STECR|nr:hypothetical protein L596_020207 [Steinernema carpocapsae]
MILKIQKFSRCQGAKPNLSNLSPFSFPCKKTYIKSSKKWIYSMNWSAKQILAILDNQLVGAKLGSTCKPADELQSPRCLFC